MIYLVVVIRIPSLNICSSSLFYYWKCYKVKKVHNERIHSILFILISFLGRLFYVVLVHWLAYHSSVIWNFVTMQTCDNTCDVMTNNTAYQFYSVYIFRPIKVDVLWIGDQDTPMNSNLGWCPLKVDGCWERGFNQLKTIILCWNLESCLAVKKERDKRGDNLVSEVSLNWTMRAKIRTQSNPWEHHFNPKETHEIKYTKITPLIRPGHTWPNDVPRIKSKETKDGETERSPMIQDKCKRSTPVPWGIMAGRGQSMG